MNAKLDALIIAVEAADNRFIGLECKSTEVADAVLSELAALDVAEQLPPAGAS